MRGFGLLIAMDAIDRALQEQAEAARKRPAHPSAAATVDGMPADGLDEANTEARMSAWRAWARRREMDEAGPAIKLAPRPTSDRSPTTT
jgi:hypothetical protein